MPKHDISLEYCVPWNYRERAVRVADQIMADYQHVIDTFTFVMGTKGAFEVTFDGALVFSKKGLGRHAEEGEIYRLFEKHVGPSVTKYAKD